MSDFTSILLRLAQVPKLGSVRIQQILAHVNIEWYTEFIAKKIFNRAIFILLYSLFLVCRFFLKFFRFLRSES